MSTATATFADFSVSPDCDDSSPTSGCFKSSDDRAGVVVAFGVATVVQVASAVYGFYRIGQCSQHNREMPVTSVSKQPENVLPESCRSAARSAAGDDFQGRSISTPTLQAQRQCELDQQFTSQGVGYAEQFAEIQRLKQLERTRLEREREQNDELRASAAARSRDDAQAAASVSTPPAATAVDATFSLGSCFFVSPDGIAITNRHVVARARRIIVIDAANRQHHATILRTSPDADLVALDVPSAVKHAALPIDLSGGSLSDSRSLLLGSRMQRAWDSTQSFLMEPLQG